MITRASRKLETTFVSVARQGLPRPARYSTPSKRVSAPALAHAPMPAPDFPAYMPVPGPSSSSSTPPLPKYGVSAIEEMQAFLRRPQTFTTLPTPVPDGEARGADGPLFMDTPTQDRLSVVDACLHGLHDVPRAKTFFDLLRHERKGDPLLAPRLYNTILHAYLRMAEREDDNRALWVEEIWVLYDAMQKGLEGDKVQPTAGTYAVMLLCWIK
jgi:DNA-directed RNA polymerase